MDVLVNLNGLFVFGRGNLCRLMPTLAKAEAGKRVTKLWVMESRMQIPHGMPSLVGEETDVHFVKINS